MVQKQNVEFAAEDNVILRGWLFVPDGPGPHPAITMAHGFAGVKEHGSEDNEEDGGIRTHTAPRGSTRG